MDNMLQRIIDEMKLQRKKQFELTDFLGLNHNTFGNWKSGLNSSYKKYIHAIAEFLNVSVEYLKGETDTKKAPPVDKDEALMFALYGDDNKDITPAMLEDIRKFAQFVRQRDQGKEDDA